MEQWTMNFLRCIFAAQLKEYGINNPDKFRYEASFVGKLDEDYEFTANVVDFWLIPSKRCYSIQVVRLSEPRGEVFRCLYFPNHFKREFSPEAEAIFRGGKTYHSNF